MDIKVLGPGCPKSQQTEKVVKEEFFHINKQSSGHVPCLAAAIGDLPADLIFRRNFHIEKK